jgi:hypothetical protein
VQAGQQRRGHEGEVTLVPGVACMPGAGGNGFEEALGRALALHGLGRPGRVFGLATAAIGLPTTTSSATRKPNNWFQVAPARAMLAAALESE